MKINKFVISLLLLNASTASAAIIIDGGPTWTPPGAGTEIASGSPAFSGGLTYSYTGMDLSQTENMYYGIKNDLYLNGFSTDGGSISGTEIFSFVSASANSIVYSGSSNIETTTGGVYALPTSMTLTFSGLGSMVQDATTAALSNANGGVGALWEVTGDFSVNILMEAQVSESGVGNYLGWEPGNDLFNRLQTTGISQHGTGSSVDTGFYYEVSAVPVPAAVWLFGSGLLGLVGVARRKKS
jgi:hypothetical protein